MIEATIVADSVNPAGDRLTTFVLKYPRFIHSELMTHRSFSRNASSSRAIPVERMIRDVEDDPAMPVYWGKNQPGMQAREELGREDRAQARRVWLAAARDAVARAEEMTALGVHKQIANRLLEPFQWMNTLVTASEWENFFALRCEPDAQPEFQALADLVLDRYVNGKSAEADWGGWHVPFGDRMPEGLEPHTRIRVAVARCARLSYKTFDGAIDVEKDVAMHDRLRAKGHMSPFEHVAEATLHYPYWGNFKGWGQYRKMLHGECRRGVDLALLLERRKGAAA